MSPDPLLAGLAALATDAPDGLLDRIAARWVRAAGPLGEVLVAFTDQGIAYVREDDDAGPDGDRGMDGGEPDVARGIDGGEPGGPREGGAVSRSFAAAFRRRFGRPLLPATRPPAGLLPALRTGRLSGLSLDLRGTTDFQREVLLAVRGIPRGEVRPYAWVAAQVGRPGAVRAVGSALAGNPVPLLVPCHRVTRSDGVAGEYVFGAAAKERLLLAEGVDLDRLRRLARERVFYLASDTTGVVCLPACHNARRITPAHRHGFRTLAEARSAGYRPCRTCRPTGLAA
ncbi:O-6-methylguanine DNA methyltransferase [Nonomuraea muscovyensis]|uniref:methylated-DNA--[protein]-cysteine S-methyltransferase n=1 Tax=Nonomuraea muscovyensis TaxID=1124761 RepID=A0A7X0CBE9_9ACTN|nr:methylated-DNA--[protein]-cysteine S-methyltransferase [Nonomuraea muscovyensis]MBB6350234.1 O-6-methylguanine DNA methyltransferase [Nonomuraea muscovyensis]